MRLFKPTYKDSAGENRTVAKWWVEVKDHQRAVRRFAAFTDKAASRTFGGNIEKLVSHKLSGEPLKAELIDWLDAQPGDVLGRLVEIRLLDDRFTANRQPLAVHMEDFRTALKAKETTEQQIKQVISRTKRIFRLCEPRCIYWRDISATAVNRVLVDLRTGDAAISKQTAHGYLVQRFINLTTKLPLSRRPVACRCKSICRVWPSTHCDSP